ncbi:MAG: bifunctional phosphopantothenoylcysteine decarboxylase/phosphopantothenate--cysteine ligase CoaBC [Rickettsiales bacterium]|nr:bifunctional phosphopantothenoylcysteine decarboxylase/phosphopantothenate--cysteine ligase CoaBC [Rickettsiales bacterium]|tara:strand:+ start:586 stop:1788 length:1203 start_codon:yes stop_codon:yes gene_type:complete
MKLLKKKKILVIVTGGIACYKALDIIRKFQEYEVEVECILTKNAGEFVNILSFESLLGKKVHLNLFSLDQEKNMSHIQLGRGCDAILIVPCTANFLAKIANGVADDLATNVILASDTKKFIAPAMNSTMWNNSVVKKNIKYAKRIGFIILKPKTGKLACGTKGSGKLMNVDLIVDEVARSFFENKLSGIKVLVTAGPSIEKIDPVRYISNFSSGTQGYEIAKALSNFGAKTTLISGPTNLEPPKNVKLINVNSGKEFLENAIEKLPVDVFISVAAISDWKSKKINKQKIKKRNGLERIQFSRNVDVLSNISKSKRRPQLVIGFSAETINLIKNSKKKLQDKGCDWILANKVDLGMGFKSKKNKVFFLEDNKVESWPLMKKELVALKLAKKIVSFFKKNKL